ncbi:MAG TPA: LysR substrate-binding domain-containing protein [Roseomonas sp.]|jgi:LysR family glycine cleavage system transcriptional activator
MSRLLPPLNPLRMFEAAARHVSFTRAATELGVTQAAVSRQVAVLESWMKVPLFERRHSQLVLTDAGARYFASIRGAFDVLDDSTRGFRDERAQHALKVRACATFARYWLIPRLPAFRAMHPDIAISLTTSIGSAIFSSPDVDAAICFGEGRWDGRIARKIVGDSLGPLCNPRRLSPDRSLYAVEDIPHFPALQSRHRTRDWDDWSAFAGVPLDRRRSVLFESSALAYQAAQDGGGIAMGQLRLLERELSAGDLVLPFDCILNRPLGYYLLEVDGARPDPRRAAFVAWMLDASSGFR